jgi:hypothetical protein
MGSTRRILERRTNNGNATNDQHCRIDAESCSQGIRLIGGKHRGQRAGQRNRCIPIHTRPRMASTLHAPHPQNQVEGDKAVEHCEFALIQHRQQHVALACVRHEVGHSHESTQDESHRPREQTDQEQCAARDLDQASNTRQ